MKLPSIFLIMNQVDKIPMSVGDPIEIVDSYGKENSNSAFVMTCHIAENRFERLLPIIVTQQLKKVPPVNGHIGRIVRDGRDLIITVKPTGENILPADGRTL